MNHTRLATALMGLTVVFLAAADASAMYDPATGSFLNRDPISVGPTPFGGVAPVAASRFVPRDPARQYRDGMDLYQYVRGNPASFTDPQGLASTSDQQLRKELIDSIKDAVYDFVKDAIHERASLTDNAGLDDVLMDKPIDELKAISQALGIMAGKGNCRIVMQDIVNAGRKKTPTAQDCSAILADAPACVTEATENLPTGSTVLLTQGYMNKLFGAFQSACDKRRCPPKK